MVSDLERSLEYYQRVIGLAVVSRETSRAALAATGSSDLLIHLETRPGTTSPPRGGRIGLYHFALLVPNRAALGRFATHLSDIGAHVAAADHAVSEALYLWDPDGLGIEVYADRPRESWRLRAGELFMTTERLDLQALMAAGEGASWNGLPSGTILGHMHLQITNLHDAEAFYHAALGFDKVVWSFPGALFLAAGGYHHHLGINTWAAGAEAALENESRLLEWQLVMPSAEDAERAARSCVEAGYSGERQDRSWVVFDPWKTALRLRAPE